MGYRLYKRTIKIGEHWGEKFLISSLYIIKKEGHPNFIALILGYNIRQEVVDKYAWLPDKEKNDIHYIEEQYDFIDRDNFIKLLGFTSRPFKSQTRGSSAIYPDGYAYYLFSNGLKWLMNRLYLRKVLGAEAADKEIKDFYREIS